MTYSDEDIQQMKKKLADMKELMSFYIDMGEDTNVVSGKIRELELTLKELGELE